eukprot:1251298-Heterocapsa_arctica.AAC.1
MTAYDLPHTRSVAWAGAGDACQHSPGGSGMRGRVRAGAPAEQLSAAQGCGVLGAHAGTYRHSPNVQQ